MILNFIDIKVDVVFAALAAITIVGFSYKNGDPNVAPKSGAYSEYSISKSPMNLRCTAQGCSVFVAQAGRRPKFIEEMPENTAINHFTSDVMKITGSCGSPCDMTFFYRLSDSKKSEFFPDILAEDTETMSIAYLTADTVHVECIFPCSSPSRSFTPRFSKKIAAVRFAVEEASFTKDALILKYLSGDDYAEKTDTLKLK